MLASPLTSPPYRKVGWAAPLCLAMLRPAERMW